MTFIRFQSPTVRIWSRLISVCCRQRSLSLRSHIPICSIFRFKEQIFQCISNTVAHLDSLRLIDCVSCTKLELPSCPSFNDWWCKVPFQFWILPNLPSLHHLIYPSRRFNRSTQSTRISSILNFNTQRLDLDCTAMTSLVFLSIHGTPLHADRSVIDGAGVDGSSN